MSRSILSKAFAEFLGTCAITLFGCGAVSIGHVMPGAISPLAIPLIFGLVVTTMIYAVGHISGAHFNPSVTLAFAIAKHFPLKQVPIYWTSQVLGAIAGIGLLYITLPSGTPFGVTVPHVSLSLALLWEGVLSFFLMFVIISVATDARAVGLMAGVAIGGAVAIGAFVGGPLTGASMNPARSIAPALFENHYSYIWLYIVGPTIGAISAALAYNCVRCDTEVAENTTRKSAKGCC